MAASLSFMVIAVCLQSPAAPCNPQIGSGVLFQPSGFLSSDIQMVSSDIQIFWAQISRYFELRYSDIVGSALKRNVNWLCVWKWEMGITETTSKGNGFCLKRVNIQRQQDQQIWMLKSRLEEKMTFQQTDKYLWQGRWRQNWFRGSVILKIYVLLTAFDDSLASRWFVSFLVPEHG